MDQIVFNSYCVFVLFYRDSAHMKAVHYHVLIPKPNNLQTRAAGIPAAYRPGKRQSSAYRLQRCAHQPGRYLFYNEERRSLLYSCENISVGRKLPSYQIEILRRRHTLALFEHAAEMLRIVKPDNKRLFNNICEKHRLVCIFA